MPNPMPFEVTFKGTVTPTATKFLKSGPLVMDFTGDIELDETDAAQLENVQKAFQSEMANQLKEQVKHLNQWLNEKDQLITNLKLKFDNLQKEGIPATQGAALARQKKIEEMEKLAENIKTLETDWKQIVEDWATNARQQQALVCMVTAVKKARVTTFNNKKWRVRLGQALKIVLVVAAVALSIAAIVLTAGTTAPIFVGLAIAGASIAGISSFAQLGKSLSENATIEKKLMANLSKDIEAVKNALKPIPGTRSSIAKHVTELRNLLKIQADNLRDLNNELKKQGVAMASYQKALAALKQDQSVAPGEIAKKQKDFDGLEKEVKSLEGKIQKLKDSITEGQRVLEELEQLGVELDKVSGQTANSLAGNLKARFSTLDGWLDLGNTVGGVVSAASGVHK